MGFTPEEEHKIRNLIAMYPKIQDSLSERESKKWMMGFFKTTGAGLLLFIGVWIALRDAAGSILEYIREPGK